jgi:hypothetical protein
MTRPELMFRALSGEFIDSRKLVEHRDDQCEDDNRDDNEVFGETRRDCWLRDNFFLFSIVSSGFHCEGHTVKFFEHTLVKAR